MLWGGREAWPAKAWLLLLRDWNPVENKYGALVPIYGTLVTAVIAMLIAVPVSFGIAFFLTEVAPRWLRTPVGTAIELLAGIPSIIYGMWGLFVLVPVMTRIRDPVARRAPRHPAGHRQAVPGPAARHRHAHRRHRAGDHGDSRSSPR
jgi:phosphate transport system permease protein